MEATKRKWVSGAQRDQYLAICRHTRDNIIFNYGSIENYMSSKTAEIAKEQSKLQSYYDNPQKGKSRRAAIISGLEHNISIMKDRFKTNLEELDELNAATLSETPKKTTQAAEPTNVSAEAKEDEKQEEYERIMRYAGYALTDCKNKQYVGEVELPDGATLRFKYVYNLNGKDLYTVEEWMNGKCLYSHSHESREQILDYISGQTKPMDYAHTPINDVPQCRRSLDDYDYARWLKSTNDDGYRTIAEQALIEAWTNIFLATMRRGKGHVLAMNANGELVDTIFAPPQSPTQPPTAPNEPTIHPTGETPTERTGTAKPTIKENLQVGNISGIPTGCALRYVTRYITPRNVCSTRMFHGKRAAYW